MKIIALWETKERGNEGGKTKRNKKKEKKKKGPPLPVLTALYSSYYQKGDYALTLR
jgi:hypothetical protein